MGIFKSKKGSIISDYFQLIDAVGHHNKGDNVEMSLYDNHLELSAMFVKHKTSLSYDQITDVYYGRSNIILNKNKSVIGRAVGGGLLLGGLGAVVGGMSGVGGKEIKKNTLCLIISYKDKDGNDKFLQLETGGFKAKKLANQLRSLCKLEDTSGNVTL